MRKRELSKLIAELGRLTPLQRHQVATELKSEENKASSIALVEKGTSETPPCPHCKSETVVRNGTAAGFSALNAEHAERLTYPIKPEE